MILSKRKHSEPTSTSEIIPSLNNAARKLKTDQTFTPFIVINSPIGMRYDKVMGQIDMYPTLLNLLQLDDYYWTGLGQSILDPQKKEIAVSPKMEIEGENVNPEVEEFAQKAYDISDMMIRFDYLGQMHERDEKGI